MDIYNPCLCGKDKKFKFCCYPLIKEGKTLPESDLCSKFAIYDCKISSNWKKDGISPILVIRKINDSTYVLGNYLIDFWCLGLKDAFINYMLTEDELKSSLQKSAAALISISYEEARNLILGSIDSAKPIETEPNSEWRGLLTSFIEAQKPYQKLDVFGKEGKPFYSEGPYDREQHNIKEIIENVKKFGGDYTIQTLNFYNHYE
ncbi:MAG: hypothetical protein JSS09_02770 [Verrucomicrobia bacterium]|nr:hypothetical protein [Verrucomicrobiota bacterium]